MKREASTSVSTSRGQGDRPTEAATLKGNVSTVTVTCDPDRRDSHRFPLICCSATRGFVRLTGFVNGDPREKEILALADRITDSPDGAFVAVMPEVGSSPGLALIQANHNSQGDETFYQRVHGDSHGIWRDYYFSAVYTAIRAGDSLWKEDEIRLAHPINGGWDQELMTVALEAIGYLTDQQALNVKIIHLDCLHGDRGRMFERSLATLNGEQRSGDGEFRDFDVDLASMPDSGIQSIDGAALYRIPLARQE